MKQHINILLVEDHAIVREGIRRLVVAEKDLRIVGEAATGRDAVKLTKKLCPDVVVMDIAMPQLNGLEATEQILKAQPATKILILSAHADDAYIDQVIAIGASGFLIKQTSFDELAKGIREVHKGRKFFSPSVAKRMNHSQNKPLERKGNVQKQLAKLSPREMEVLQLIAEGAPNKQTAEELGISIKTVEKHREHLMVKLDIHDTAGLARYAIATGMIESSVHLTIK